jgi:hypothetical protein
MGEDFPAAETAEARDFPATFIPDTYTNGEPINIIITATNANGEGDPSSPITGSPIVPTTPPMVTVNSDSITNTFKLTWSTVSTAQSYMVYRSTASTEGALAAPTYSASNPYNATSNSCYWSVSSENLTNYFEFTIAAVDGSGNIGPMSPVSAPITP